MHILIETCSVFFREKKRAAFMFNKQISSLYFEKMLFLWLVHFHTSFSRVSKHYLMMRRKALLWFKRSQTSWSCITDLLRPRMYSCIDLHHIRPLLQDSWWDSSILLHTAQYKYLPAVRLNPSVRRWCCPHIFPAGNCEDVAEIRADRDSY